MKKLFIFFIVVFATCLVNAQDYMKPNVSKEETKDASFYLSKKYQKLSNKEFEIFKNNVANTLSHSNSKSTMSVTNFPWIENFESRVFPPQDWTLLDHDGDGQNWGEYSYVPHSGGYSAASASWSSTLGPLTPTNLLITPAIELPVGSSMQLQFWVAAQDVDYPNEHYEVMISTTGTSFANFTSVFEETLASTTWTMKTIDLSSYAGQTIYVAFTHNESTDVFMMKIDDVSILDPSACYTPTNLTLEGYTDTNVSISWETLGTATEWNIEYGPTGFAQGTGNIINSVTENPYTIGGLLASTTYDVYIRTYCSASSQSAWSTVFTCTTALDCSLAISTFPYTENFEDVSTLDCWTIEHVTGTKNWVLATGTSSTAIPTAHSGLANMLFKNTSSSNPDVTKLVTAKLDISALTNPVLDFWHAQKIWSNDQDELRVYYKNSAAGTWTMIFESTSNIESWKNERVLLPNKSAEYYIAFEGTAKYGYGIVLDDVSVYDFSGVVDAEVLSIVEPVNAPNLTNAEVVKVRLKNRGSDPITGFSLKLYNNNTEIATETYTGSIGILAEAEYQFTTTLDLSVVQEHNISVKVILAGDQDITNDSISKVVNNYGDIIIMGAAPSFTKCGVSFYDDGVYNNYVKEQTSKTLTLNPINAGDRVKVDFTEMIIAEYYEFFGQPVAGDTLYVYEGSTVSASNLLGTYSGDYTNELPSIISYSSDGALTFVFNKSGVQSESGWVANVTCVTPSANDAGITEITSPLVGGNSNSIVTATIKNYGGQAITSMDIAYKFNGGNAVVETFSGNIVPGASVSYSFAATLDMSTFGEYTVEVYTMLTNDANATNDTKTINGLYAESVTLYGYRRSSALEFVSFTTSNPEPIRTVSTFTDDANHILAGEYFNKNLYLFTFNSSLVPVNFIGLSTESWTSVLTTPTTGSAADMAYDYNSNKMYAVAYNSNNDLSDLCEVNLTNGSTTIMVGLDKYFPAIACDLNGNLYGMSAEGEFCSINKLNGTTTVIKATQLFPDYYFQSMAFDHLSGRLFYAYISEFDNALYEIIPASGNMYKLGLIGASRATIVGLYTPYSRISVPEVEAVVNNVSIYPNPSNGQVNINVSENSTVKVVDVAGRLIDTFNVNANSTLNFTQPAGMYFVEVESNGNVSTHKVVIR